MWLRPRESPIPSSTRIAALVSWPGQSIADSFITQLAIHRTASGGPQIKKRRSCFLKKGTANFASRNANSRALWLTRTNHALPPKNNFSAQAKLRDRSHGYHFCERVEAEILLPTPTRFRLVQVII